MSPGSKIFTSERITGMLVVSGLGRSIHTVERGVILTVEAILLEEGLIQVKCNSLRLLFARENLEAHGKMVLAAG